MTHYLRQHPYRSLGLLILTACLIGTGYRFFIFAQFANFKFERKPHQVITYTSKFTSIPIQLQSIATSFAKDSVDISSHVTETIQTLDFEPGTMVSKAEVIVQLTNHEEQAKLAEEQANLKEAEINYLRTKALLAKKTVPESELDSQRALLEASKARVDIAKAKLNDRVIKAPFAGLIGFKEVSPGTLVQPGHKITSLDDISSLKLEFSLPERYLSYINLPMKIEATTVAYPGKIFFANLDRLSPRLDEITHTITLRASLLNPDMQLRPGQLFNVSINAGNKKSLFIPEQSILANGNKQFILIIDGKKTKKISITTGRRNNGWVEITGGLEVGMEVIAEGAYKIKPDDEVNVVKTVELNPGLLS